MKPVIVVDRNFQDGRSIQIRDGELLADVDGDILALHVVEDCRIIAIAETKPGDSRLPR